MIPYHGGPFTPEPCAFRAWRGRHAFISWFEPRQIDLAASCCQSFALDNGAYSFWKRQQEEGAPPPHWPDYYAWCATWFRHRACDWAVIPDVIGGTEEENDALLAEWPFGHRGVPVWHLQESVDRLVRLASAWPRIALGSAAEYDVKRPAKAVDRLRDVGSAISDGGVPRVKLHGFADAEPRHHRACATQLGRLDEPGAEHRDSQGVARSVLAGFAGDACRRARRAHRADSGAGPLLEHRAA